MSLRTKSIILLSSIVALLVGALALVYAGSSLRELRRIEDANVQGDLARVQLQLNAERSNLSLLLADWSYWDVPADLLNKAGRPTEEEWAVLASHPTIGGELVEPLADWLGDWRLVTSQHHERWDGTGYPNQLAGQQISLAGRIVAVADAYDVITSARSYKKPMSATAARQELVRCSGTQFDPTVVRAFLNVSIGHTTSRTGMLGWLLELPRVFANAAGQAGNIAGGVVAASSLAAVASVAIAPPPPPIAAESTPHMAIASTPYPKQVSATSNIEGAARRAPAMSSIDTTITTAATAATTTSVTTAPSPSITNAAPPTTLHTIATPSTTTAPPAAGTPTTRPPATTAPPTTAPTTTRASNGVVARPDLFFLARATTTTADVLANDSNAVAASLSITTPPQEGTASIAGSRISFTAPDQVGVTQLTYRVCDATARCTTTSATFVYG